MEYSLIRSKRKTIVMYINKEVIIKAPLYLSVKEIDSFIFKHQNWIENKLKSLEENHKKAALLRDNKKTYLYGEKYKILEGRIRVDYLNKLIFLPFKSDIDSLYKVEIKRLWGS